jgi:hypothetical protein
LIKWIHLFAREVLVMKLDRRQLLTMLPFGLAALFTPMVAASDDSLKGRVSQDEKQPSSKLEDSCGINADDPARVKISKYNAYLKENRDFNWAVHNELRHLYGGVGDERSATEHSDIILQYSLADGYILDILSGWQSGHDNKKAISNLLYYTKAYPQFKYVGAACLLKIADLYAELGQKNDARDFYRQVMNQGWGRTIASYSVLAQARLETLERTG